MWHIRFLLSQKVGRCSGPLCRTRIYSSSHRPPTDRAHIMRCLVNNLHYRCVACQGNFSVFFPNVGTCQRLILSPLMLAPSTSNVRLSNRHSLAFPWMPPPGEVSFGLVPGIVETAVSCCRGRRALGTSQKRTAKKSWCTNGN